MSLIECVTFGLSLSSNHRAHQRQSKPPHLTPAFTLLCPSPSLPPVSSPHSPYVCCTCSSSSCAPPPLASPYPPYVCYTSPGSTTVPALFPPWLPYLSTSSLRPFLPLSTHPAISSQHLLLCKTVLTVTYTLYQVLMISAAKLSDDNSLGLGKKQQLQQLPCWRCRRPPPPLHNPQAFSPPT